MIQTSVTSAVSRDISPVNARRPELPQSAEPNVDQVVIAMEATVMVVTVTGSEVEIVMVVTVVVIVMVVTVEMVVVVVATQMPDAIVATEMVILPVTARRLPRDVTNAISQDIWPRIVKMKLKVVQKIKGIDQLGFKDHATTVERLVIYNVIAHKPPPRTATSARSPDIWPVTAPPRSVTTEQLPTMVMTELATTAVNQDTFHVTAQSLV